MGGFNWHLFFALAFAMCAPNAWCQSEEGDTEIEEFRRHRATVMMANTHVPAGDNVGSQGKFYVVPTWGLNYDYWIKPNFALGLHNDLLLQDFEIDVENAEIERTYPVVTTAVILYKPWRNLTLIGGGGREFEKHEDFNVLTMGAEYSIELPRHWELSFNLVYDSKLYAYDSWLFGIGFSKFFE